MSNSLLSSAAIAVIVVIVSGYVISSSVDMDTVADVIFTGLLDAAYAAGEILSLNATGSIGETADTILANPLGITTFKSGSGTYAAVTSFNGHGVQILNITNPSNITAASNIGDTTSLHLKGAYDITTFKSGSNTYAAVASFTDSGVQILNITNPSNITAAGSIGNTANLKLNGAVGIATFKSGSGTYAAVAAFTDSGVQILNITNPLQHHSCRQYR